MQVPKVENMSENTKTIFGLIEIAIVVVVAYKLGKAAGQRQQY